MIDKEYNECDGNVCAKVNRLIGYYDCAVLHEDDSIPTYRPVSAQYDTKPITAILRGLEQYYIPKSEELME